ncbi:MAG: hypothetical protein A3C80_01615 [Candidatus Ryanbacteria bacterium RIFCSPHIGHO2_02_FULL_45_43]|uniref:DNA recombination protein RmuC n=1 Tax=Candidatus Ryanbacteria bacterium RIFCSPHIGHO2_01_45_13 TaxID=1802112 RepID=A0A1G2FY02_9BACT|nr:MAG: hypothetical protein A2718_02450 [Candidatus Ryanbacteria bacterium RIFCSPHIGHO2_01_FULL_44_130]OGZ42939.1 MAG: hypothetical protein A2W41_02390 [Candidatus Ryanbacteria bacterium RIFCSPHIGHO2_01_45_13]OGZ48644.1 MAG: hypothetical protein A3C80_01615 [Candidatus Ryanbacteria bacterium RIFCSPHIGHO2_02_FULL_45_43]OGZ50672.1 MAG: hypothetical protein A3E55_03095 [Candidatus Ryanbacteria bacterium RIFCSPHIGHO2_12_FULL_44_20]OGZ51975.1 MAG: hypothetical protein A3A17_00470 [Candidatus Ryanba
MFAGGIAFGAVVVYVLTKKGQGLSLIQNQINEISRTLDMKLGESSKQMHESMQNQYRESKNIIREVTERLTRLDETNKQIVGFADQLQSLQDILQNPKQRGVLGEYYLETVLKNVLPVSAYAMQYKIGKSDDDKDLIVDAAIFVADKIIPVDSKFSLENYNRLAVERSPVERARLEKLFKQDLKNRIDETAKYVRPQDSTMDFALMFIPSEAIYYDLTISQVGAVRVNTADLIQYGLKKRVHIVSPNSFYAFLQTIMQGLRQMQIEQSTKEILKRVQELSRHITVHDQYMSKLGSALGTSVSHYNSAYRELKKVDKDVLKITGSSPDVEPLTLEKPEEV